MAEDLRKKREAYFAELAHAEAARGKKRTAATRGRAATRDGDGGEREEKRSRAVGATAATGRARGCGVLKTSGLAMRRGTATAATKTGGEAKTGEGGGGKTITEIPKAPKGDPCDLDLERHDVRRFAKVRLPRDVVGGSEARAQIFPNGPVVRFTVPVDAEGGEEVEFAVDPWTADDVPPKPPGGAGVEEDEEAPPPPPGEPPAAPWTAFGGRVPPPPPPPPVGAVTGTMDVPPPPPPVGAVTGTMDVPPPPPGSP